MNEGSLHYPNTKGMDLDEQQEYACLILEGHTPADAKRLARAANDKVNSRRLSGPNTGDTRNGHGDRPLISDMNYSGDWENVRSIGVDDRSLDDMEDDWAAEVDNELRIQSVKDACTPRQWEFLARKFGLDGYEPAESIQDLADQLGISRNSANSSLRKLRTSLFNKGLVYA
jgi:hypothetical protein